jgi:tetratricopeptide (TPR) repeat protein
LYQKYRSPAASEILKVTQLAEALALHRTGRLADAEKIYRQILTAQPNDFDCLHLLGVIAYQHGHHTDAVRQIDLALKRNPDNVFALSNRGNALKELRRFDEALASYDRALSLRPDYPEAYSNRGNTLQELRRFEEALASYDKAISLRPDYAEAYSNRGNALYELKRFDEALASYDRALALRPDYAEALSNRGNALHALKRFEEALSSFDRALILRPDYPKALSNRGNVLRALKRPEEALQSYDRALALRPDSAEFHTNRGTGLRDLRRFEEALASHDRAIALRPDYAEAHYNRGNALDELHRVGEALTSFEQATALRPDLAEAHCNRGNMLVAHKRFGEALQSYARAVGLRRDYADAHFNEAICRLLLGDFRRGWDKHEWRWKTEFLDGHARDFEQKLWLGTEQIAGKTILLHAEQGLGDTIQFCRYAPLFAKRGARVILEVQRPLRGLLGNLPGVAQVVANSDALPSFDLHCPLLSLPLAFGTDRTTIPAHTPYLQVPSSAATNWDIRLGSRPRPRIGLVWSGRAMHKNDHNRSIGLDELLPLLDFRATFVSLQHDVRADDAAVLRGRSDILHIGGELNDFADTAAVIENLDLVISVDTSVAHLAGALGKPVWVLLPFVPDWRWLLDCDDSPWYPTARLFRQDETRRWDRVIAATRAALSDLGS